LLHGRDDLGWFLVVHAAARAGTTVAILSSSTWRRSAPKWGLYTRFSWNETGKEVLVTGGRSLTRTYVEAALRLGAPEP
jgi:hypothetical protein